MNEVIIGIGSNDNALTNVASALCYMENNFEVINNSTILQTKAYGDENQPDYLNCGVKIKTNLSQSELKSKLEEIENQLGRDKSSLLCTIDLDVLTWNEQIIDKDYYSRDYIPKIINELN